MEIPTYLAMTPTEFDSVCPLPPFSAWMGVHFSSDGLTQLPRQLPPHTLLILDDSTPWNGQNAGGVVSALEQCLERFGCDGLLLDFQRQGNPHSTDLAGLLPEALPCPVAVSEAYAEGLGCPVFVSMIPPHVPAKTALAPWQGRPIWLELGPGPERFTVTEDGSRLSVPDCPGPLPYSLPTLHSHLNQEIADDRAVFTLSRTETDLQSLLEEAASLGVTRAVGLWQELGSKKPLCRDSAERFLSKNQEGLY